MANKRYEEDAPYCLNCLESLEGKVAGYEILLRLLP